MPQSQAQPMLRVNVLFCFFAYGGNGGVAMQLPAIGQWWAETLLKVKSDPRVAHVADVTLADTPITMTRNRAVRLAREGGFHVLVMVDSDNEPDIYAPYGAPPFWDSTFDFLYERLKVGLPTVCAAPYCGPPPHPTKGGEENVYVFRWTNHETHAANNESVHKLEAYSRAEASHMAGIHPAGALPTGLLMATTSAFDLCCPDGQPVSHFYYEWKDAWQTEKCSTEDVTATRDISLAGHQLLGEEVVFCNWDCWAGHHKPKCVGKPVVPSACHVGTVLEKVIRHGIDPNLRSRYLVQNFPHFKPRMTPEQAERTKQSLMLPAEDTANSITGSGDYGHVSLPPEKDDCVLDGGDPSEESYGDPWTDGAKTSSVMLDGRKIEIGSTIDPSREQPLKETFEELKTLAESVSKKKRRPIRAIDFRSRVAESAIAIAQGFTRKADAVYCVDPQDRQLAEANADDLYESGTVRFVDGLDLDAMDPQEADLVFVSGSQGKEVIQSAARHVADGGLLVGLCPYVPDGIAVNNGGRLWTAKKPFTSE